MLRISDFEVLSFDCYGTLVDWETGIARYLGSWAVKQRIFARPEELLHAFAQAEARIEAERPTAPYSEILQEVYRAIASSFAVPPDDREAHDFAVSVGEWPVFPDTPSALRDLKQRYRLIVVSNVDRESFSMTRSKLGVELDGLVIAEDVGAYKPDIRMFQKALELVDELGADRSRILHVAQSLYHDHIPAKKLGLRTVWINRRQGREGWGATRPPGEDVAPDIEVSSMSDLVLLDNAQRSAEAT